MNDMNDIFTSLNKTVEFKIVYISNKNLCKHKRLNEIILS